MNKRRNRDQHSSELEGMPPAPVTRQYSVRTAALVSVLVFGCGDFADLDLGRDTSALPRSPGDPQPETCAENPYLLGCEPHPPEPNVEEPNFETCAENPYLLGCEPHPPGPNVEEPSFETCAENPYLLGCEDPDSD